MKYNELLKTMGIIGEEIKNSKENYLYLFPIRYALCDN